MVIDRKLLQKLESIISRAVIEGGFGVSRLSNYTLNISSCLIVIWNLLDVTMLMIGTTATYKGLH